MDMYNMYVCMYVELLINNSFFQAGSKIFRQVIGIPMGSDPAPFFANLFLFFYESRWLKFIKNTNYGVVIHIQTSYTLYRVLF